VRLLGVSEFLKPESNRFYRKAASGEPVYHSAAVYGSLEEAFLWATVDAVEDQESREEVDEDAVAEVLGHIGADPPDGADDLLWTEKIDVVTLQQGIRYCSRRCAPIWTLL